MRIALDAMGGDHAPGPVVAGAVQAIAANPDLTVVLVGDEKQIHSALTAAGAALSERLQLVHAADAIGMHESPVEAMRKKPDNTIARGWRLMAEGKAQAFVGAGSTGAMVTGGLMTKRFLKGIKRPGIAAIMPTAKGPCVVLDVGANVSPKPEHLLQYGIMGAVYSKHVLGRDNPTIGLMNVGEEQAKGHDLAKETHALFAASPWRDRFVGNVEGRDLHAGKTEVVVTDGFVGNVLLKVVEGVFEFIMRMVAQDVVGALSAEKGQAMLALKALTDRYHYSEFGGAPLLGVDGVCIVCHGSSKEKAIRNALSVAAKEIRTGLNDHIIAAIAAT